MSSQRLSAPNGTHAHASVTRPMSAAVRVYADTGAHSTGYSRRDPVGSRRDPWLVPAPEAGDQSIGAGRPPRAGGVRLGVGRLVEQRLDDPPGLLDGVLAGEVGAVTDQRGVQQDLVRCRSLAAFLRELHLELDLARSRLVGAEGVD